MPSPTRRQPRKHRPEHPDGFQDSGTRAVLRGGDAAEPLVLEVAHGSKSDAIRLNRGGESLLAGDWGGELQVAGERHTGRKAWRSICAEVNDNAEYVELERTWDDGTEVERQVFLARRDQFAILADVVKLPQPVTGTYRLTLPLAPGVSFTPGTESTEGVLRRGRKRVAQVLPLGLPEWQGTREGSLSCGDSGLCLELPTSGRHLHAILWLDLAPERMRRPITWRRLTVAQALQAVPRDVAVGYRVQIGRDQWLVYRSLAPRGNRSVLGQNFSTEFVVARFPTTGVAEKLLEIE